ncbi:MAG TPA: acyl carrier protein [Bacteroidia bacterium]|jgi:acyl carrier protein|nr:acyl carrier protein [Bacteroidia bacterium]
MDINEFIQKLQAEFEDIPAGFLKPETKISDIEGWGSMHALIVIALIDTEFGVTLKGDELRKIQSVQELYDMAENLKNNPQ